MTICDSGHVPVAFDETKTVFCPVCEVLAEMSNLVKRVNALTLRISQLEAKQEEEDD